MFKSLGHCLKVSNARPTELNTQKSDVWAAGGGAGRQPAWTACTVMIDTSAFAQAAIGSAMNSDAFDPGG